MIEKTASTGPEAPVPLSAQAPAQPPDSSSNQLQTQTRQIRLTNAIDEALILRELLSPKSLRTCELEAWPDPSQTYLLLPSAVVRQLGLRLVGQRPMRLADDHEELVSVTEAVRIEWNGQQATEEALVLGERVVLGGGLLKKLVGPELADPDVAEPELTDPQLANRTSLDDDPWFEQPTNGAASVISPLSAGANGNA